MDRRGFVLAMAGSLLARPLAAGAQPAGKVPRVGVLSPTNRPPRDPFRHRETFEAALRELGWTPGTNIVVDYRYAEGKLERLRALADELARIPVDVIVARSGRAIRAAQEATARIPIVMSASLDPVRDGFVESLAHPMGNITGLALQAQDLGGKQLELLKELIPNLSRIAVLRNPSSPYDDPAGFETPARVLRLEVKQFPVKRDDELAAAFDAMSQAHVGGVLVRYDPLILERHRANIVALSAQHRLPAVYSYREFAELGGLMFLRREPRGDPSPRRGLRGQDPIKGAKPGDLPVEQPTKYDLVINLKTAKALGLTIPQSLLQRADQVIE
jgi:putative ABC transport system substrate-binding protein